ncbi:hypothetical protein LLB_0361 [Legionella longbeachae D-4968]|nr:hypothetical protein LLB_0361 [Legionella longbeachae D-4968]
MVANLTGLIHLFERQMLPLKTSSNPSIGFSSQFPHFQKIFN